jgi:hypothetical protein
MRIARKRYRAIEPTQDSAVQFSLRETPAILGETRANPLVLMFFVTRMLPPCRVRTEDAHAQSDESSRNEYPC